MLQQQEPQTSNQEERKESLSYMQIGNGKFIVFVNPASGKGLAQKKWQQALVILNKTGHTFNVIMTEHVGHCKQILHDMKLDELLSNKGIILVSGDGLPHEAINGIFTRKDWQQAKEIPFGFLPGGSGNAIAKNVSFVSQLNATNENNARIIARGSVKNIDLMLFQTKEKKIFSFLSLTWAFISDVDLGSEGMRFLGEARFTVMGTWRSIFQKKYPGVLYITKDQLKQEIIDALVDGQVHPSFPEIKQTMEEFQQSSKENEWSGGIQRDYKYFMIAKQPYISESFYAAPLCKLDDGLMDIQVLHGDDGWGQLVSLALNQEKGKHIDMKTQQVVQGSKCKYDKISAFRLEPSNQNSSFSIDGEKYESQPIQGVVLRKMLKVFCL